MYTEENVDKDRMKTISNNITVKLNDEERRSTEGNITEYECSCALREMNNNKGPGSDGITTECYKIYWNGIKYVYHMTSLLFSG